MASKAMSIQFLLSQVRSISEPLNGGSVTFYEAGTTTPKTIWLDRDKDTEAANPYTLDANGTAQLYGDGLYKILIKNSAGSTVYTRDYIQIVDPLSSGVEVQSGDYASLNAAIAAIGSTPTTLNISSANFPVTAPVTVPATLALQAIYPGSINQSTHAVTINGPFTAGRYQVFTGSGSIKFGSASTDALFPEWWGAIADNSTDCSAAVQAMVTSAKQSSGSNLPMSFGSGDYKFTNVVIPDTGADAFTHWRIYGVGMRKTKLRNNGTTPMFTDNATLNGTDGALVIIAHDLDVLGGTGADAHGFYFKGQMYNSVFRNILGSTSGNVIRADNKSAWIPFSNKFEHVLVNSSLNDGIYLSSGLATVFDNCYFQTISAAGKAGVRLLSSGATFQSCNGLDAGEYWAIIGATQALDGFTGTFRTVFIHCRFEDFEKVAVLFRTDGNGYHAEFIYPVFIGHSGYEYDIRADITTSGYVDYEFIKIIEPSHSAGTTSSVAPIYANKGNVIIDGGNITTITMDGVTVIPTAGMSFGGVQDNRAVGASSATLKLHDVAIQYASQNAIGGAKLVPVSGIPTTGTWNIGDMAMLETGGINTWSGGFAGLSGAKYILLGWRRLTTGSNHVLNTDWAEMRVLTGS